MGLRGHAAAGRRIALAIAALAAVSSLGSSARAQVATATGAPGTVDIKIQGEVTSAIEISVTGTINLLGAATTTITGSGTSGVVNFGVYNIPGPLLTGEKNRANSNPKGTYLVATLEVAVRLSGGPTSASIDIQRSAPYAGPPDVPLASLFFAVPAAKNLKNRHLSWPTWKDYPDSRLGSSVFQVPDSTFVPGSGNLATGLASMEFIDHQVAVWIPDSQPAGPFSTTVTYTGTAL